MQRVSRLLDVAGQAAYACRSRRARRLAGARRPGRVSRDLPHAHARDAARPRRGATAPSPRRHGGAPGGAHHVRRAEVGSAVCGRGTRCDEAGCFSAWDSGRWSSAQWSPSSAPERLGSAPPRSPTTSSSSWPPLPGRRDRRGAPARSGAGRLGAARRLGSVVERGAGGLVVV